MNKFLYLVLFTSTVSAQTITDTHIITSHDNVPRFVPQTGIIASVQNGNWNSTSTWSGGTIPSASSKVRITHDVNLVNGTFEVDSVEVGSGGELNYPSTGTTILKGVNFQVLPGGLFRAGIAADPVVGSAKLQFKNVALQTGTVASPGIDPEQYGNSLLVWGNIILHGMVKTSHLRSTTELSAGATQVVLVSSPVGWQNGDRIVFPDTRQIATTGTAFPGRPTYTSQGEERTITNVSGATITFTPALTYAHNGPRDQNDVLETGMLFHVANLTRTVNIESENPLGVRGHTFVTYRGDADIKYASFHGLGRTTNSDINNTTFDVGGNVTSIGTNQVGRYAIHFHHNYGPINTPINFTADSSTDVFTATAHGYASGEPITLTTTGGLPSPLVIDTPYFVRDVTANTFKLASTLGGAAINITTNGTPTNTARRSYQGESVGNVIENFFRWGLAVHNSHYNLIQNNIVYDGQGNSVNAANGKAAGGIATEIGNESYNVFDGNFVMHSKAGSQQRILNTTGINVGGISGNNIGRSREGYWNRGMHNYYRNNVACNCSDFGFNYNGIDLSEILNVPNFRGADMENDDEVTKYNITGIKVGGVIVGVKLGLPILEFADNEIYGATGTGIWVSRPQGAINDVVTRYQSPNIMDDTFLWHITNQGLSNWGAEGYMTWSDFKVRYDETVSAAGTIQNFGMMFGWTYYSNVYTQIIRPDIQGCNIGIQLPFNTDDGDFNNFDDQTIVTDAILKNHVNLVCQYQRFSNSGGALITNCTSVLINARGGNLMPVNPAHIWMDELGAINLGPQEPHTKELSLTLYEIRDWQGNTNDDFDLYFYSQHPLFIVPPYHLSRGAPNPDAPGVGGTMQELWNLNGTAFAGRLLPGTAVDGISQNIMGYVNDVSGAPPTDPNVTLSQNNAQISETGGVSTVTATLSFANDVDTTINLGFAGTATNITDYTRSGTSIVITAGQTTGSRTINAVHDTDDESNETVITSITSVVNGTENTPQAVTTTIIDDDTPSPDPTVTIAADTTIISELNADATITATLSFVHGQDVTITFGFTGTANTLDYALVDNHLVIPAGQLTAEMDISSLDDFVDEPNETVIVDITAVVNGTESGTQQVTITINDNDRPPRSLGSGFGFF